MFVRITVLDTREFVESMIARKLGLYAIVEEARAEIRQTDCGHYRVCPHRKADARQAQGLPDGWLEHVSGGYWLSGLGVCELIAGDRHAP